MKGYVYMHTLDGQPATFEGDQICFASYLRPLDLVENIQVIKQHQKATRTFRKKNGWSELGQSR